MPETQKRQAHYRCQHYRQPYLNVRHQKFWQMLLVRKFKVVTMSTKEKNFTSPHCEPMAQTQQSDTMHIKPNSCRQRQLILHIYMAQYTQRNRIASQVSYLKKAVHHTVKQLTAGVDGDVQGEWPILQTPWDECLVGLVTWMTFLGNACNSTCLVKAAMMTITLNALVRSHWSSSFGAKKNNQRFLVLRTWTSSPQGNTLERNSPFWYGRNKIDRVVPSLMTIQNRHDKLHGSNTIQGPFLKEFKAIHP